jgi:pimeloyl-ACP methyl ester carboxylesterase
MPSQKSSTRQDLVVPGEVPIHTSIHPGTGPALVLIHGISSSGEVWLPLLDELGRHFTPVTVDLRGHGNSGKPETGYLYDDYIGDVDRVLDHLNLATPLIVGHSLGGLVTLWWAAQQPARAAALVIEDSPLRSGEDFRPAFDNWIRLNGMELDELRDFYACENPHWKREVVERRTRQMHATAPNVFSELKADSMAHHGVDRIAEIEHVQSPALLIHGDLDSGGMVHPADAEAFTQRLGNASAVRIPGGNHGLHADHMRAFLAAAVPFLLEHSDSASHLDIPTDG